LKTHNCLRMHGQENIKKTPLLYFLLAVFFVCSCVLLCDSSSDWWRKFALSVLLGYSVLPWCSSLSIGIVLCRSFRGTDLGYCYRNVAEYDSVSRAVCRTDWQEYRWQSFGGTFRFHCQVDVGRGDCRTCGCHLKRPAIEQRFPDPGRRLNLVRWGLIFVGPQYQTCFMSPAWRSKFEVAQ
jgi:hypothetical protein